MSSSEEPRIPLDHLVAFHRSGSPEGAGQSCQDLPTQIQAEVPASWEAFSVGLMGIIIRFHILLCLSPFLTHQ